ncbi:hypothetical protein P2G56_20610 [Cronobacter malonaticus]|uniref:hypothetical protein n=1 Tax=Cronobacter malonaticus TaxID=413503 RepID=UPI002DC02374|nr:hypothetical protein [Cronobacter malonaticus]MEB8480808.1 hypothetical protein [Cronobacter malonaticus]
MKELQYAVDNIDSIKKIEIKTSQGNFDISSLLDYTFKGKALINIEVIESDKPSFLEEYIDDYKSILEPVIVANNQFSICIKGVTGEEFTFGDQQELHDPTYRIGVYLYKDVPHTGEEVNSSSKKELLERASIINIHVVARSLSCNPYDSSKKDNKAVRYFSGLSELGFMLTDINLLESFLKDKSHNNDLIEEFTTTELANEIFNEGLMVLSWGNTPWVYYILSCHESNMQSPFIGYETPYNGKYYLKEAIKEVSVIPGHALRNWDELIKNEWPKIKINGKGDLLSLKLYVKNALSQHDTNYPIPTFLIVREEKTPVTEPLLESYL